LTLVAVSNSHFVTVNRFRGLRLSFTFARLLVEKGKGKYHFFTSRFRFSRALCVSFCPSSNAFLRLLARPFRARLGLCGLLALDSLQRVFPCPHNVYIVKVLVCYPFRGFGLLRRPLGFPFVSFLFLIV
jgi:hypothetical protein